MTLYKEFGDMPYGIGDDNNIGLIASSVMSMNAAWKTVQLGRGVVEGKESRISVGGNYGTFEEMVQAMYKEGRDKSGGNKKVGILRAAFELAKDLKQIHAIKF